MSQSLSKLYVQIIFHIKNSRISIGREIENKLYAYMAPPKLSASAIATLRRRLRRVFNKPPAAVRLRFSFCVSVRVAQAEREGEFKPGIINIRASQKIPNSRLAKFVKPEFTDRKCDVLSPPKCDVLSPPKCDVLSPPK